MAATVAVVVALAGTEAGWASTQAQSAPGAPVAAQANPPDDPGKGLRYGGLRRTLPHEACKGAFEFRLSSGQTGCTHGPDPAPPGVDVREAQPVPVEASEAGVAFATPPCQGDGVSGPRVQLVYAHAAGVTDRYNTMLGSFRTWAAQVNDVFNLSAAETGGTRNIRFVHDASCNPTVLNVTLTATGDDNLSNTITELRNQGHNRSDRKYLVWADANVYCGIAQIYNDDRDITGNYNNGTWQVAGMVARVDAGCWGNTNGLVEAHELVHNLGGVQTTAPNATANSHCVDDYDRMCYTDGPGVTMRIACSATSHENRLDCNHDDYYSTNPPAGSYLDTHWNVADSSFLAGTGSVPTTTTTTLPPATTTTTTRPPTTTSTTTTTVPPGNQRARFVDKAYRDLLARPPSAGESSTFVNGTQSRSTLATALTTSTEYRRRIVNSYYTTMLGRNATAGELDALVNAIAGGWPFEYAQVIVLGGDEFYTRRGATAGHFVDALYAYVLGIAPDAAGRAFWVDQITNQGLDRYTLALAFCTWTGTRQRLVTAAYPWLLRRSATALELTAGTAQLDAGVRQEAFFASLVASDEYWSKV